MSGIYAFNPECTCDWCLNGGINPRPKGYYAALGYDNPHFPPDQPTRIIALLSWYDEDPAWLERCIRSLAKIPVDHLLAVDGAYAIYPDAEAKSDPAQSSAIRTACEAIGVKCDIFLPSTVWEGNEIEKRNRMFAIAETIARPRDWYLVIDADEFITSAPPDTRNRLAASPFDVAAVTLDEPGHPQGTIRYATFPMLFRAIPGLRAVGEHFRYQTPDGRLLWGDAKRERIEPRHDLTSLMVQHHNQLRHPDRRQAAKDYYATRDALGIEDLPAQRSLLA